MKANGTKQHQRQQFDCAKRQERKKDFRSARSRHSNCNVIVYEWECECVIYNKVKKKCGHNDVFICWVYCHCPDAEVKQKAHALTQREQRKNIDTDNDRKKEKSASEREQAGQTTIYTNVVLPKAQCNFYEYFYLTYNWQQFKRHANNVNVKRKKERREKK